MIPPFLISLIFLAKNMPNIKYKLINIIIYDFSEM